MSNDDIIATLQDAGYTVNPDGGKIKVELAVSGNELVEAKSNFESWCGENSVTFASTGENSYILG